MSPGNSILDHSAYPHILDLITLYSSRHTLLRFRTTCHTFLQRADNLLCSNRLVVASDTSNPHAIIFSSNFGALPACASWALLESTLPHRRLPLHNINCVDIVGFDIIWQIDHLFSSDTPPLTIRILRDAKGHDSYNNIPNGFALTAHTVVRFTSLSHLLYTPQPIAESKMSARQRTVYNITLNSHHALHVHEMDCLEIPYLRPPSSREVVYVLRPGSPEIWVTPHAKTSDGYYDAARLLYDLIKIIVIDLHHNWVDTTIVGINALTCMQGVNMYGLSFEQDPLGVFLTLCAQAFERLFGRMDYPHIAHSLDRIKLLSLEEYREMVGPERAAVETCQSGEL